MSNLKWKREIGKIWPANGAGRKVILLYHSVGESLWGMPKKSFQDQINWLHDHCQVVSLDTLIHGKDFSNDLQVALTFDDGYQSLYDQVAPILSEKNLSATVYLNTGWLGENNQSRKKSVAHLGHYPNENFLVWPEVMHLYHAGWLIGSHGINHHNFTLVDATLTLQELTLSKQNIEQRINTHCMHFAYPFGRYSASVKEIVKQAGYRFVATARHGSFNSNSDLYALPRINIEKDYTLHDFQHILKGKWDYLNLIHKFKGL